MWDVRGVVGSMAIAGRYRLENLAGRGGMGEVWKAVDAETGAAVALKRMLDADADVDRFTRESVLLSRVKHDALVAHVAHGVDAGIPWLAMEWIEGETLVSRLAREGLSLADSLALGRRIAGALSALHAQGIVHRDLKPANVMLPHGRPDQAVLLDLGVARTSASSRVLTATNVIVGTIGYMAPEQALSGRDVTACADVFSLGCVLFECLTGVRPFEGKHVIELLARLLQDTPRRVRTVRPEVPEMLDSLVASMLARETGKRPRDGAAVLAALEAMVFAAAALREAAPRVVGALTDEELSLALAAVVDLGAESGALTGSEPSLRAQMDRVCSAAQAAGGEAVRMEARTALVVAEARGTVTDRASVVALVARAIVTALPSARMGLAAGLATGSARLPVGELLERAERLARSARPGGIAVDAVVHDLLAARFEIHQETLGAPRSGGGERRVMGKAVPFVGREKDMSLLEATVAEAIEERGPRALLVLARPGTGKSRLAQEFVETRLRARQDVTTLEARAEAASAGTANAVLRGLARAAIGLRAHGAPEDHAALRTYVRSLPDVEEHERLADFLGELAGAPRLDEPGVELASARGDGELMSRWMRRSVREWLGAETARKPLVMVIEDLHWSDEATVVNLGEALRRLGDRALVVIALARPEVGALFREPWRNVARLELGGLGARAAERIARAVLGSDADSGVIARVVERADGNPYFLEELVRFVAEGRGDQLPANVLAVLHARLAELEPELRRVLRAASVLGERFAAQGVAEVAGMTVESVRDAIDRLMSEELLERTEEGGFAFRHALARDATYATLAEVDRRAGHERAANWLERQPDPSPRAMMAHLEAAGAIDRAIPWVVTAAAQSFEMGGDDEAFGLAKKGLALGASGIEEGRLHALLAYGALYRGDFATQLSSGRLAMERLPTTHPDWFVAASAVILGSSGIGDVTSPAEVIGRWLAESVHPRGVRTAYMAQYVIVTGLLASGMTDPAKAVLAASTPPRPGTPGEAWVEFSYTNVAWWQSGQLADAFVRARRARNIALRCGDGAAAELADVFLCLSKVWCVASEERLAELNSVIQGHVAPLLPILLDWFVMTRAALEARMDDEMGALRRCAIVPNIMAAEYARYHLRTELVRLNSVEKLEAELSAYSPNLAFARTNAAVCSAFVALWRGQPERALAELTQAEELARMGAPYWGWELLHACRAGAFIALGRKVDAAASVRAGLVRLAYTLEGIDEDLRAGAEVQVDAVKRLRALAKDLGVTETSESAPG